MAVIMCGEVEEEPSGVKRYRLNGFVVVVDGSHVVTTYFDSDMRQRGDWNPKKKQRRGQRKEAKPAYIPGRGKINIARQESYLRQMEERR